MGDVRLTYGEEDALAHAKTFGDTVTAVEAILAARLAAVEALARRWSLRTGDWHPAYFDGLGDAARELRAALAAAQPPATETTPKTAPPNRKA